MAGSVGNYSDGETLHGGDLNLDLTSVLGNDAQLFLDLFGGWNILVSGFMLSAGTGLAVTIAAGLAYASGTRLPMAAGSVTLAAANTQPRYDVIWVQTAKAAGTNPTTGNPTQSDSGVYGVLTGTAGSSPVVPSLGDPTKVQIGVVYVPANVTGSSGCVLLSQQTAPNAQGPVKTFIDLLTHIAASLATSVVHGYQATSPGAATPNQLAVTSVDGYVGCAGSLWDGYAFRSPLPYNNSTHNPGEIPIYNANGRVQDSEALAGYVPGSAAYTIPVLDVNGAVGKAEALASGASVYTPTTPGAATPNQVAITSASGYVGGAQSLWDGYNFRAAGPYNNSSHSPGEIPIYNANGRVQDSEALGGAVIGAGNTNIPTLDTNGAVAKAEALVTAGVINYVDKGQTAAVPIANQTYVTFAITFNHVFAAPPVVVASPASPGAVPTQYGLLVDVYDVTTTGCTLELGQTVGITQTFAANWIAVGS